MKLRVTDYLPKKQAIRTGGSTKLLEGDVFGNCFKYGGIMEIGLGLQPLAGSRGLEDAEIAEGLVWLDE